MPAAEAGSLLRIASKPSSLHQVRASRVICDQASVGRIGPLQITVQKSAPQVPELQKSKGVLWWMGSKSAPQPCPSQSHSASPCGSGSPCLAEVGGEAAEVQAAAGDAAQDARRDADEPVELGPGPTEEGVKLSIAVLSLPFQRLRLLCGHRTQPCRDSRCWHVLQGLTVQRYTWLFRLTHRALAGCRTGQFSDVT